MVHGAWCMVQGAGCKMQGVAARQALNRLLAADGHGGGGQGEKSRYGSLPHIFPLHFEEIL